LQCSSKGSISDTAHGGVAANRRSLFVCRRAPLTSVDLSVGLVCPQSYAPALPTPLPPPLLLALRRAAAADAAAAAAAAAARSPTRLHCRRR